MKEDIIIQKANDFLFKKVQYSKHPRANINEAMKEKIEKRTITENELLKYLLKSKGFFDARGHENKKGKANSIILQNEEKILSFLEEQFAMIKEINSNFEEWHRKIITNTDYGMRVGVWQKIVNITFKNMYCIWICTNGYYFDKYKFDSCHCPVDSIISGRIIEYGYDKVAKELLIAWNRHNLKGINWNSMNVEQYDMFQTAVDFIKFSAYKPAGVLQSINSPSRLDVDLLLW